MTQDKMGNVSVEMVSSHLLAVQTCSAPTHTCHTFESSYSTLIGYHWARMSMNEWKNEWMNRTSQKTFIVFFLKADIQYKNKNK